MNRQQLRDYCCRLRGWELTHTDDLAKVDDVINQSLRDISSDAPGALLPSVEHLVLWPDLTNTTEGFTVDVVGTDQYVLEFNNSPVYTGMNLDGEWDGIFHIEVKDPSGVWHRRQCREFWQIGGDPPGGIRVSLDRPWRNATDSNMEWRLHQPYAYTRDDVIDVLGGRSWDSSQHRMVPFPMTLADFHNLTDFQGNSNSDPEFLIREGRFQMPSPSNAPTLSSSANNWLGPMNRGEWRVCYTYCWGRRSDEWQQSPTGDTGVNDPMWESAPSPISSIDTRTSNNSILITTPDPEFEMNFEVPAGRDRDTRSGWYKRIYVARVSVTSAPTVPPQTFYRENVETANIFHFLADIAPGTTAYDFNGATVVTYDRRLPEVHGYWKLRPEPHQDQRYEFDLLVRRRHPQMLKDTDAPNMGPHALKVLITRVLYYLARMDQDNVDAASLEADYKRKISDFKRTDSAPAKNIEPTAWGRFDEYGAKNRPWNYSDFSIG